jgi:alcohol dehydrogenase class IV
VNGALKDPSTGGNPVKMTQENTTRLLLDIINA